MSMGYVACKLTDPVSLGLRTLVNTMAKQHLWNGSGVLCTVLRSTACSKYLGSAGSCLPVECTKQRIWAWMLLLHQDESPAQWHVLTANQPTTANDKIVHKLPIPIEQCLRSEAI